MHDEIAGLINHYYGNKLESFTARQKQAVQPIDVGTGWIKELLIGPRLSFIEVQQQETFKSSPREAAVVAQLVKAIKHHYGREFDSHKVGIMTPWRAQISEIQKAIGEEDLLAQVTVDTIERYQGSEKEIIIISTAIYSPNQLKMIQSLNADGKVDRKLNVAISRAKDRLIMIGNPANLSDRHYLEMIERIKTTGLYLKAADYQLHSQE